MMVWDVPVEVQKAERGKKLAAAAHYTDLRIARQLAREIYLAGCVPISADDVRRRLEVLHPDIEPGNWLGALFRGKEWQPVGFTKSRTPGSHANRLVLWRLR